MTNSILDLQTRCKVWTKSWEGHHASSCTQIAMAAPCWAEREWRPLLPEPHTRAQAVWSRFWWLPIFHWVLFRVEIYVLFTPSYSIAILCVPISLACGFPHVVMSASSVVFFTSLLILQVERNRFAPVGISGRSFCFFSAVAAPMGWKGVAPLASRAKHNSPRGLLLDLDSSFCCIGAQMQFFSQKVDPVIQKKIEFGQNHKHAIWKVATHFFRYYSWERMEVDEFVVSSVLWSPWFKKVISLVLLSDLLPKSLWSIWIKNADGRKFHSWLGDTVKSAILANCMLVLLCCAELEGISFICCEESHELHSAFRHSCMIFFGRLFFRLDGAASFTAPTTTAATTATTGNVMSWWVWLALCSVSAKVLTALKFSFDFHISRQFCFDFHAIGYNKNGPTETYVYTPEEVDYHECWMNWLYFIQLHLQVYSLRWSFIQLNKIIRWLERFVPVMQIQSFFVGAFGRISTEFESSDQRRRASFLFEKSRMSNWIIMFFIGSSLPPPCSLWNPAVIVEFCDYKK